MDYIEERRYETKNHDVIFIFYLTLAALRPSVRIGEFRPCIIQQNVSAVISSKDNPAQSDPNFSILVLHDKDGDKYTLLFKKLIDIKTTHTIPSSTWINDFQERLGLGKFLIVEIPHFCVDLNSIDNASLSFDQKDIGGKEDAYMNYLITSGIINSLARKFILIAKRQSSPVM
jgi:hypothetical protein